MGRLYISGEFRLEQLRFSLLLCSKYFPVVAFAVSNAAIKQIQNIKGPRRDKACLRVSDKARFKSVSSATETS